jgi:hypothetical protein
MLKVLLRLYAYHIVRDPEERQAEVRHPWNSTTAQWQASSTPAPPVVKEVGERRRYIVHHKFQHVPGPDGRRMLKLRHGHNVTSWSCHVTSASAAAGPALQPTAIRQISHHSLTTINTPNFSHHFTPITKSGNKRLLWSLSFPCSWLVPSVRPAVRVAA